MKSNICIAGFWVIAIIFVRATNEKTKYKTRKKQKQKKQVDRLLVGYYNFRYWLFHVST